MGASHSWTNAVLILAPDDTDNGDREYLSTSFSSVEEVLNQLSSE